MGIIPYFVAFMEKKAAPSSLLTSFYARRYNEVIRKEISLANITSEDHVLNVGCGGIPYTALQIAGITGARVWAIDRDKEAVKTALRYISFMKMEDRVTALNLDGTGHFPFKFDVAIVALQSEPKKEILENLIKYAEPGARLVFRRPRAELYHQYDLLPETPVPCGRVSQNKATFDCSVLYKVTGEREKELSDCRISEKKLTMAI